MSRHIDGVVVRETAQRLAEHQRHMQYGIAASEALLWFKEHCQGKKLPEVFEPKITVVAYAVVGASKAREYLEAASRLMQAEVYAKAVELAQRDLDEAEAVRKPKERRRG